MNSSVYQKKLNAGMACGVAKRPDITRVGDLFKFAKAFCRDSTVNGSGFNARIQDETYYNYFGDPALEFRETPEDVVAVEQFAKNNTMSAVKIASVTRSSIM